MERSHALSLHAAGVPPRGMKSWLFSPQRCRSACSEGGRRERYRGRGAAMREWRRWAPGCGGERSVWPTLRATLHHPTVRRTQDRQMPFWSALGALIGRPLGGMSLGKLGHTLQTAPAPPCDLGYVTPRTVPAAPPRSYSIHPTHHAERMHAVGRRLCVTGIRHPALTTRVPHQYGRLTLVERTQASPSGASHVGPRCPMGSPRGSIRQRSLPRRAALLPPVIPPCLGDPYERQATYTRAADLHPR